MDPVIIVQLIPTVLVVYLLIKTILARETAVSGYFALILISVLLYSAGYLMELSAQTLDKALSAQCVQYCGGAFLSMLTYLFFRDYNDRGIKNKWVLLAMMAVPVLVLIAVIGYPYTTMFFKDVEFLMEPEPHLIIERGLLFNLFIVHNVAYAAGSSVEIITQYPGRTKNDKGRKAFFVLAATLPFVPVVFSYFTEIRLEMQLGSITQAISVAIIYFYLMRFRVVDWLPYARGRVIEQIGDGFIMVDMKGCFVDANTVAKKYYPALEDTDKGTPVFEIEGFPKAAYESGCPIFDFEYESAEGKTVFRSHKSDIIYGGKKICTFMNFYDVTQLYELMEELEVKATQDPLTGLRNRSGFFELASRDFDLHLRTETTAAFLMLDLDHFKRVNDQYGHPAGDLVLREFAEIFKGRLRHTDIDGRYGGEEFCVFLPATELSQAYLVASDIRRAAESKLYKYNNESFKVTVSAGIAQLRPERHSTLEALIEEADKALYIAKENGRNRVECYDLNLHKEADVAPILLKQNATGQRTKK